ncbi:MAG: ATP-dependent DNA helicase RecG [Clostridia bacterium]|nr:ATP-dependent DNA helicase RecG [Clostridia bacterium]
MKYPLTSIKGVGEVIEKKLRSLGVTDVESLLTFLPKQYVDMNISVPLSEISDGAFCLFDATIEKCGYPRRKGNLTVFTAEAVSGGAPVKLVWFNHKYVHKVLSVGEEYTFFGKAKFWRDSYEFNNPFFEKKAFETKFSGITPIYPTKGVLGQGTLRNIIAEALKFPTDSLLSQKTEEKLGVMSLHSAFESIHRPTQKDNSAAHRRVLLERLTERIAAFSYAKKNTNNQKNQHYSDRVDLRPLVNNFGFSFTPSQTAAVERIFALMRGREKMNVVLCGDVGSGKTAVAVAAAYLAVKSGHQAAIVAPTELLAAQHAESIKNALSGTGVDFCYLTGSSSAAEKREVYQRVASGEIGLVIGTHAVFSDKLRFKDLALAVCDEQHRFGVAQRNSLVEKGSSCDVLTLSATPIPRTVYLAAYGEAEFIPLSRRTTGNIKTSIVPKSKRADMFRYIADVCNAGGKVYLIAPRISDAEGIERENCEDLYEETCRYLDESKVGLMHGRLPQEKKDSVMRAFRDGEKNALVATTVVEVGVDVPDASVIVITDADRLGLAALHQLRGRVGRRGQQSYCFLCGEGTDRLKDLVACDDGFELAERDFDRRGGGEIFGLSQSGSDDLKIDARLLATAKAAASDVDVSAHRDRLIALAQIYSLSDVTFG